MAHWRRAEKRAKQIAAIAKTKNHIKSYSYFSAKLAKFLIMQQHFAKAEKILRNLQENEVGSSQIRGITYHYLGLSFLFRGELENAVYEFNRATKERHQFLGNSYMNIGIAFAKMGKFLVAKRYVRKSIRIFSQCGDRNHLAYAYNNMGAILSHSAKREAAHHFLEKSVHLGQALKNNYIVTSALNNISQIYEMEARPDKAIEFYRKSTRIAGHEGSKINRVAALSNYGLQCAMQGDFNRAIQVLKNASVEIKTAGLKIELGFAYEYLGLTHMFSERPKIAVLYLHKAKRTFTVTGCDVDKLRINLYLALAYCHLKQLDTAANILASSTDFADDSFELGLRNYVSAYFRLIRGGASRATWTGEVRTAESIFRKVHNIFWLAKLHSLKGDFHLQNGEPEKADMSFERAADIFSRIGARKQPSNLKRKLNLIKERADMNAAIVKSLSYRMLGLIETLLAEETIDAMVAKILAASLELSQMVRGVLIIYGSPPRIYQTNPLEEGKVEEISELSGWALQSCLEFSTTYITSQDPHMSSRAIGNKKNLPLSLYFPLKTSESLLGMLYLEGSSDSRVTSKQLDVFANIASMNLERALKSEAYENQKLRYRKLLETRSIDV